MVYLYILSTIILSLVIVLIYVINLYIQCTQRGCPVPVPSSPVQSIESTTPRDVKVLRDPLYPPLNRTHINTHTTYQNNPRLHAEQTRPDGNDRFRLVGYLVSQEDRSDSWKLFARDTGRGRASFYAMPSNKNNDIKISLDPETNMPGPKLRDIYDIPTSIQINHPMLPHQYYNIIELEKTDFTSQYI